MGSRPSTPPAAADFKLIERRAKKLYNDARQANSRIIRPELTPEWEDLPREVKQFWRKKAEGNRHGPRRKKPKDTI